MIIGGETSKGGRAVNQDALLLSYDNRIFVIADGAGGHNAGEVASGMVTRGIIEYMRQKPCPLTADQVAIQGYFVQMIKEINAQVFARASSDQRYFKMATTMVMLYLEPNEETAYVFHVGDSRAYLARDHEMMQITEDHTYVNELLKRGKVLKEEVSEHPMHHVITRAIGGQDTVKIDTYKIKYRAGDIFMLCTDGLYNEVTDEEMCCIMTDASDMQFAAKKLVEAANLKKSRDNITAICVKI